MVVNFAVVDHKELSNVSATYAFDGATSGKTVTPTETATAKSYTFTIPAAELDGHKNIAITVNTTNASNGKAASTVKADIVDEPVILSYSPESATGTGSNKQPTITVKFANVGEGATVDMLVNNDVVKPTVTADTATYTFPAAQQDGKVVVSFTVTRKDGKSATQEWSFYIGEVGIGLYFGQFHSHTSEYSDGAGTLEQAYEHAMNAPDVDFLIVTDHSNYFDTTATATMDSIHDDAAESLTKSTTKDENGNLMTKWQEAKATAEQYNSDSFVAAYGYEMTWSGGPGHTNTFNTKGIASRNNATLNNKTNYSGMLAYYDLTVDANAKGNTWTGEGQISGMFNHPGVTFGTFGDFTGYTPARDAIMNLIEVGNGEGAVGGSSYWPSYEHFDNALAMGWHIAPANNQDNHKGNHGDANTCRDVVITDNFTEQGIYDAMAARHIYATEDQNLNILYYLKADANGDGTVSDDETYLQGDIISTDSDVEIGKVTFNVSLRDPDGEALGKIEIIGEGGKTLWSKEVLASSYEMNETLDNTDAYYYIKVTEADGQIAVTAPVWVGETLPILFTSIATDSALSVVGEEETVTANFSNSSEYDFEVTKLSYTVDGKDYFTDTKAAGTTVAAGNVAQAYTLKYTPAAPGKHVIEVVMEGIVPAMDNKKVSVSIKLTIKSYAASSLINVGVDSGHTNYYVSGDYSGNTNNFVAFCADNGARCYFIDKGEFTYDNLKQYKLLFLTVPYLRNTAAATMYTAEEIAALKQYTENGGSVVICSKSDRDNKFDNCANNTNALLEAIGAHSRMVNGIIVDNELKANEAYRLYFSALENFNTEHRFTKGAYTSSNAFETVPDPKNQTGFQVYNGGPVEIMDGYEDKVDVLIKGYDTTWGSHYDGYFTGSAFVPEYDGNPDHVTVNQGDVNVMTYEDLPGGGWVVTSGVTFFSNYDIKDDQNYANKYILRNIIDDLTGARDPGEVTPIATVKATPTSENEKQYTIEGYITANASGYNKDTAFFDCIYVQEKDGAGINVFPVAGYYKAGMHVRVHGAVTWYCGEIELNTSDMYDGYVKVIGDDLVDIEPEDVSCKDAMADKNIGQLMRVTGKVKRVHETSGVVDKIFVTDNSGAEACVFINGYILNSKDEYSSNFLNADGVVTEVAPGMDITAVGIGSRDVDESSATAEIFARLRVRDRAEIVVSGEADYAAQFDDVEPGKWYYKDVQFVSKLGLMAGVTTTTFGPNIKLTRAMAVSILYRLEGRPALTSTRNPFPDVTSDRYYYEPVLWGAANNIVAGITENEFAPNAAVSRWLHLCTVMQDTRATTCPPLRLLTPSPMQI